MTETGDTYVSCARSKSNHKLMLVICRIHAELTICICVSTWPDRRLCNYTCAEAHLPHPNVSHSPTSSMQLSPNKIDAGCGATLPINGCVARSHLRALRNFRHPKPHCRPSPPLNVITTSHSQMTLDHWEPSVNDHTEMELGLPKISRSCADFIHFGPDGRH